MIREELIHYLQQLPEGAEIIIAEDYYSMVSDIAPSIHAPFLQEPGVYSIASVGMLTSDPGESI